eukprot:12442927-Alexandrium_andersonii.AAC.1
MSSLGLNWEGGRAEAAPLLDGLGWESSCARASPDHGRHVEQERQDRADVDPLRPRHEGRAERHGLGLTARSAEA